MRYNRLTRDVNATPPWQTCQVCDDQLEKTGLGHVAENGQGNVTFSWSKLGSYAIGMKVN